RPVPQRPAVELGELVEPLLLRRRGQPVFLLRECDSVLGGGLFGLTPGAIVGGTAGQQAVAKSGEVARPKRGSGVAERVRAAAEGDRDPALDAFQDSSVHIGHPAAGLAEAALGEELKYAFDIAPARCVTGD